MSLIGGTAFSSGAGGRPLTRSATRRPSSSAGSSSAAFGLPPTSSPSRSSPAPSAAGDQPGWGPPGVEDPSATVSAMKILVCSITAPLPPLNGFRLQLRAVCAELATNHEVVLLTYRWPEQTGEPPEGVEMHTIDLPRPSAARRTYDWLRALRPLGAVTAHKPMAAAATRLAAERDFDVLHVAGWNLAGIGAELPQLPAVLTTLDASFLNYRAKSEVVGPGWGPLYRREARRVRRFERRRYPAFDSVVVVSDEDAAVLEELDPRVRTAVLPNGVDAEHFAPGAAAEREPNLIIFTGAMQWAPNEGAALFLAEQVLPLVRERVPDARLALVGRSPGRAVAALDRLDHVEVTGEVEEIRDWLHRGSIFACPMVSGTGIKNKLLEAMATELACVASPLACRGMNVGDGRELLIAEGAEQHADRIVSLLQSPERARELAANGREYVLRNHSWAAVGEAYEHLLERAIAGRATTPNPGGDESIAAPTPR